MSDQSGRSILEMRGRWWRREVRGEG